MSRSVESNVKKIKFLSWTWGFLMLTGVTLLFFKSRGLRIDQIYMLHAVFAITMSVLEIPTGYFSDIYGRKITLIIASVFKGIGGTILAAGHSFESIMAAYIFLGIANSFYSGSNVALLYESLPADEKNHSKFIADLYFIGYLSLAIATVIGGYIAMQSFEVAGWVNAAMAWASLVIAFTLVEPEKKSTNIKVIPNLNGFIEDIRHILKILINKNGKNLNRLANTSIGFFFILSIIYIFPTIISQYAFQERWHTLAIPLAYSSLIVAALGALGAFVGRALPLVREKIGFNSTLLVLFILPVASFFGASINILWVVLLGAALMEIVRALVQVTLLHQINTGFEAKYRATANSILSFSTRIVVFALAPLFGVLIERSGDQKAFFTMSIIYSLFLIVFSLIVFLPLLTNFFRFRIKQ